MDRPKNSISLFWYQRLCEGTIFLGIVLVLLFGFAAYFSGRVLPVGVPIAAMSIAILATITGIIGRVRPPAHPLAAAWGIFVAISLATFTLVLITGGLNSSFLVLWLLLSLASGMVGLGGILFTLWVNVMYIALALLMSWWTGPTNQLVTSFFVSLLPLGVSFLLWRSQLFSDSRRDEQIWHLSERLSREASKSAIIINAIADAVIVISKEGVVQLINPAGQRLTGWEEKEAMQLDYRSVLKLSTVQDQPLQSDDPIQKVMKTGKPDISTDLTLTTKAGKKALLSLVVSPILSDNQPVGAIAVFRDITKEKAEEREKAEFISTASHEMRTPVAAIEGYLALAMNPQVVGIDEKGRSYLAKAHEATQHLGRLFQDLLTISKAEDGRLANNPQVVEVVAFIQKLWEGQRPKAEAKNIKYLFVPTQGHGNDAARVVRPIFYANIDPDRLSEVVNNLIDNAIKYTAEGEVTVDVTADEQNVLINVKDSGIGIAKEDMPHLFQKFYRVDSTYTREVGGTGLGLYISRKIMEQSGGQLRVESELGKGSTFIVQLPRLDSEKAAFLRQQITVPDTQKAPA
ncbi:MAG TPA: ATP-binding protein [Candidatus Saccharimonadales bacterium]|nr:ATP-binding protein [Candidatus Saccharimonadales bacterium]